LLLLAVATAMEAKPLNPSRDTSPYHFTLKFEVKFANSGFKFYQPRPASWKCQI